MKNNAIPLVDLSLWRSGDPKQKEEFVEKLGEAFHKIGFVAIKEHGISQKLIDDFYDSAKKFFALPEEIKKKYEIEGLAGQRGYTSFGKEHAKQSEVPDLKEFFQIGQEREDLPEDEFPPNVKVYEAPEFTENGRKLYREFERTGGEVLKAIALYLNLDQNYFEENISGGNSILRAIHYPPIQSEPESAIRAEQHEDINLITLLAGASAGGLQVMNKKSDWVDVLPEHEELVVNVGDMLQRLTNDYLKSTTHRVVNPSREEWHIPRLSIPFFLHPKSSMDLSCLVQCVPEGEPLRYEPITAGEYLDERLKEIGLKK